MKRFIKNIFLFLLIGFPFYFVFIIIFGSIPFVKLPNLSYGLGGGSSHSYSRLKEAKELKNVDILFLGSSHAYRGFDVRIFKEYGFKTFNLGTSSQTPIQTKLLLDRYLNNLNPKLAVYAINLNSSDGVESAIDILSNDKKDFSAFLMTLKINNIKVYNTFIYGIIRDFFNIDKNYYQPLSIKNAYETDNYISGGYVEKKTGTLLNIKTKIKIKSTEKTSNTKSVPEYQLKAFSDIINTFLNRDINYLLLLTPVTDNRYNNYVELLRQYEPYSDFNEILDLDDSYFYDANHLKQEGAEIFSSSVAELIISKGYIY